jgi:hypothetical protein
MKQVSPGVQTVVGASSPGDAAVTVSDLELDIALAPPSAAAAPNLCPC